MYESETRTISKDKETTAKFESKVLRSIFGDVKE